MYLLDVAVSDSLEVSDVILTNLAVFQAYQPSIEEQPQAGSTILAVGFTAGFLP
jgi:hypothetical protein